MIDLYRAFHPRRLLQAIEQHPEGISEHTLLKSLLPDHREAFSGHLSLFQTHFILFHSLYRLQDHLLETQSACLEIHTLAIRLLPYHPGQTGVAAYDPLRDYYLDTDNLNKETEQSVAEKINAFFARLTDDAWHKHALDELGLKENADTKTIKKQYRKLAMQHHPDRGGDKDKLQRINAAYKTLIKTS